MIARIIVFLELGRREDWGKFEFVALPSAGDGLSAPHEGTLHPLPILEVVHLPRARQVPGTGPEVRIITAPKRG